MKITLRKLPDKFFDNFDNLKRCDFAGDKLFNKKNPASYCIEPRNKSHRCTMVCCPLMILDGKGVEDIFLKKK